MFKWYKSGIFEKAIPQIRSSGIDLRLSGIVGIDTDILDSYFVHINYPFYISTFKDFSYSQVSHTIKFRLQIMQ